MTEPAEHRKNLDIECLKCGAMNIAENRVCGRCGANLPLIYDEEGKVFNWREDPYYGVLLKQGAQRRLSPQKAAWVMRLILLFSAVLLALWIMRHR